MMWIVAEVDLRNPLLWAVLIGWVLSVILHEFAHGIVAYWGGDYTIRERGGLTLNPLQYIDPMMSLVIPGVILLMGGIPLPGGSTYIRRDLLRNRFWESAVALAGPVMNLLVMVACLIPLHPRFGWVGSVDHSTWTTAQLFLGAMAVLQLLSLLFNLVPVPPLDGFETIAPFLPQQWTTKVTAPPMSTFIFFVYFIILWNSGVVGAVLLGFARILHAMGFGAGVILAYVRAFSGQ
ncbi:MAG: site-2 protease family protein [Bacillota bacterium]